LANRVDALKKVRGEGWEVEARMMNSIKMCGVSWTILDVMVVREHTSKGAPTLFWKHNFRSKEYEEVERNVANGCDKNEFGREFNITIAIGDHHASGVDNAILAPPVQGNVTSDLSLNTKLKELLQ
jgi:hypothetical protein